MRAVSFLSSILFYPNPLLLVVSRGFGGRQKRGWRADIPWVVIVRASTQQPRLYVGMVLILIFAEVLGLYGVIVSILMLTKSTLGVTVCPY